MEHVLQLWGNFDLLTAGLIFFLYIIIDGLYAYYTFAVTDRKPAQAASAAALLYLLLAVGVLNYVQNYLYIIPLAAGSWAGTYLVVRFSKTSPDIHA